MSIKKQPLKRKLLDFDRKTKLFFIFALGFRGWLWLRKFHQISQFRQNHQSKEDAVMQANPNNLHQNIRHQRNHNHTNGVKAHLAVERHISAC